MGETVAAIDCGTNTIKLLVGALPEVAVRETRIVRLGQGVDATGRLADEALVRVFAAIDEYAAILDSHDISRVRFCATSATRDSSNADLFREGVHARLGVWPEVLSGAEEAALAYDGAVRNLRTPPELPVLVVDIGGGSTELVLGDASGPTVAQSMDMGSVRMHERYLTADPPSTDAVAACVADIDAHLDACPVPVASAVTVVAVAGTVSSRRSVTAIQPANATAACPDGHPPRSGDPRPDSAFIAITSAVVRTSATSVSSAGASDILSSRRELSSATCPENTR